MRHSPKTVQYISLASSFIHCSNSRVCNVSFEVAFKQLRSLSVWLTSRPAHHRAPRATYSCPLCPSALNSVLTNVHVARPLYFCELREERGSFKTPLPEFLLVPSLDSQLAEVRLHLSICLSVCGDIGGRGGEVQWTGLPVSHEQAGLRSSCPSLKHTAASSNNGIPALLTVQHPTSHPLPSSLFLLYFVIFLISFCLNHTNTLIGSPDLSRRRLADGSFLSHAGLIVAPSQVITRPTDCRALLSPFTVHTTSPSPSPFSPSPCLLSKALPSLRRLPFSWIAPAEWWHQEEGWGAKALRLLPSRLAGHRL